jgi:hypothetical protein
MVARRCNGGPGGSPNTGQEPRWHLGSIFFTLKICPDRPKIVPNSPNISKFGLRWACLGVALHVIEAASQPLPLPIHHQCVTWRDLCGLGLAFPSGLATWVSHQNRMILSGWHLGNANFSAQSVRMGIRVGPLAQKAIN